MSFSYTPATIAADAGDPISAVRFLLGDVVEAEAELQDEEITAVHSATSEDLTAYQRVALTAAQCALSTYRRYARLVTFSSGGSSVNPAQRAAAWREIADDLAAAARAAVDPSGLGVIYASR